MQMKAILLATLVAIAMGVPHPPSSIPANFNPGLAGAYSAVAAVEDTFVWDAPVGFMSIANSIKVTGKKMETDIFSLQGIQYGMDPSGDKRFKKVELNTLPEAPLDAFQPGAACPQMKSDGITFDENSNENCLFLNVYSRYGPSNPPKIGLPVMVYIHGGSFVSGSASLYKPDFLLEKDVILVTIQYRLGMLGFYTENNQEAPGNAGLWDQIRALQWVQKNIGFIGGDPAKVTIFGEGAGATSVNMLLLFKTIPEETGQLFSAAIMQGGSALDYSALNTDYNLLNPRIINECGCIDRPNSYDCLKTTVPEKLTNGLHIVIKQEQMAGKIGTTGVSPVVQNGVAIDPLDILLSDKPENLLKDNTKIVDVPVIIGANKHEGSYSFGVLYWSLLTGKYDNAEYLRNDLLPAIMQSVGLSDREADMMKTDYIGDRDLANLTAASPGLIDLTGVLYTKSSTWLTAKTLTNLKNRKSNTYFYSFDFESDDSLFNTYFPTQEPEPPFQHGVCHGDELIYLFNLLNKGFDESQNMTRDRLVTLWTNFAINNDPTPKTPNNDWNELGIPKWEALTPDKTSYLLIEEECTASTDYPLRYHIALEDAQPDPEPEPPTSEMPTESTDPPGPSQEDYDHIDQQRTAFMACMIVFIILTVTLGGLSGFIYYKQK